MFSPGDLVVCVDAEIFDHDHWVWSDGGFSQIKRGSVYTIRASFSDPFDGDPCVWLVEILRPLDPWTGMEAGYLASRFRPITRDRLEIFRSILRDAPVDDKVSA